MKSTPISQTQMDCAHPEDHSAHTQSQQPNYIIEGLILIGFLLVPLIYTRWTFDPVLFPRTLVLQLILLVGLPVVWLKSRRWLGEALSHELPMLYLIFILFGLLSLVWAPSPLVGFYDLIRYITVALFYIFALLFLRHISQNFLLKTLVISGLVLAAIGLIQSLGWGFSLLPGATQPPYATMVNKNIYASVMLTLFAFPAVSIFLLESAWRYLSLLAAFAIGTVILLTGARGAWVGLAAGLTMTLVLVVILVVKHNLSIPFKRLTVVYVAGLTIGALAVVLYGVNLHLTTTWGYSIWHRIARLFDFNDIRFHYWQDTLKMVKDAPVGGIGVGNWKIGFPIYYSQATNPARPHNDFLWILAEKGVIGLLIYLTAIGFHIKSLTQALFSKETPRQSASCDQRHAIFLLGVFFATTAYLVNSVFTFPRERIYVSMLFATCLALSTHTAATIANAPRYLTRLAHLLTNRVVPKVAYALLIAVFAFTLQLTYVDGFRHAALIFLHSGRQDPKTIDVNTISRQERTNFRNAIILLSKAINHWLVMDVAMNPTHWYRGAAHFYRGEIKRAKDDFETAYRYHPNHSGVLNSLGLTYAQEGHLDKAMAFYRRALAISPTHLKAKTNLDNVQRQIAKRHDPAVLNTHGITISFLGPVEQGVAAIRPEGGADLGWRAEWADKWVRLMPVKGKALDYGITYIVTIEAKDTAGDLLYTKYTVVTATEDVTSDE